jgi:uncharacterized membrane protein
MQRIEKSIRVACPVRTCYNQWTQFESFPRFMEAVEHVEQLDNTHLHWVATVAGKRKEWNAEIVEQVPDEVVAWRSTSGALNNGSVTFKPLGEGECEITLVLTYEPEGIEKLGQPVLSLQVEGDLRRFKEFVEQRQVETGAWRGEVHEAEVEKGGSGQEKSRETPKGMDQS